MMKQLEKMLDEAIILDNKVIKVDQFVNHQINIDLFREIRNLFYEHFKHQKVTKIVTCEASGIAVAMMCGLAFNVDVVFAKKGSSLLTNSNYYTETVYSYTKQKESQFMIDRRFINENDHVLLVDDFLANGEAMNGLISICHQARAAIVGLGVVIEKGFQVGGKQLREKGYDVCSLVIVDQIENNQIIKYHSSLLK